MKGDEGEIHILTHRPKSRERNVIFKITLTNTEKINPCPPDFHKEVQMYLPVKKASI